MSIYIYICKGIKILDLLNIYIYMNMYVHTGIAIF